MVIIFRSCSVITLTLHTTVTTVNLTNAWYTVFI
ncbi:hypothetical protein VPHK459_0038 [Vibrio phage K459]